jgi:YVTN family beta-propeller protein
MNFEVRPGWLLTLKQGGVVIHPENKRLYVSDLENKTYVLDGSTHEVIHTLPVGGKLALISSSERLFVFNWNFQTYTSSIHVFNTVDHSSVAPPPELPWSFTVAVDESLGRLYGVTVTRCEDDRRPCLL